MYLHFCFSFLIHHSCRNYKFYNRIKICAITAEIKRYKSIHKKNKNKHDETVLLAKTKFNSIAVLISRAFSDSNISNHEFVLINNVLKAYNDIK